MSLIPQPAKIPTGMEVECIAVAMAATIGLMFHTLDEDNRFRLRVMASAALVRLGLEDKPALGDRELVKQLIGIADAAEAAVRALDADEHNVPDATVKNLQRAATVARTLHDIVTWADLPEVDARPEAFQAMALSAGVTDAAAGFASNATPPPCDVCGSLGRWVSIPGQEYASALCPDHEPREAQSGEVIAFPGGAGAQDDAEDEVIV